jgi:hypothetical protein
VAIENGLHDVREVALAEDTSKVRTGTGPQVMAWLRNLAIGALGRAGPVNLAAALRHHARDPHRSLVTLGISPGETDITKIAEPRSFRWRTHAGRAVAQPCPESSDSKRGGLVPMTTVAESSSELATRATSPSPTKVSAARGA